jgi:site-specific recombinase XerD
MAMPDRSLLGTWVRRFLLEHVVAERNLSRNTQASYRDTLTLLLPFASACCERRIDRMTVEDLSPEVVRKFLDHLEQDRHCSGTTRNQRLSAINSLARFVGMRSPVHVAWCTELRSIPCKKTSKALIGYLEKTEIDALLRQPDRRDVLGARDHALLLYLYNSGSRADEAARLSIGDLRLDASPAVRILGKGNKLRMCPLWPVTAASLMHLVAGRDANDAVFISRRSQPMTRFGIHRVVVHYAALASTSVPSLVGKRVSPHTIRHTTAVHLLRAGVDINTIRAWLGHVSLDTTHVYAEVDMEMKAKALASVDISGLSAHPRRAAASPSLMTFLKALQRPSHN